jgi:hypothetical protein
MFAGVHGQVLAGDLPEFVNAKFDLVTVEVASARHQQTVGAAQARTELAQISGW